MPTRRHRPIPPGRRMFDETAEEPIDLGDAAGMTLVLRLPPDQGFGRPEISRDRLVFAKPNAAYRKL